MLIMIWFEHIQLTNFLTLTKKSYNLIYVEIKDRSLQSFANRGVDSATP